jgi:hypothetical protein
MSDISQLLTAVAALVTAMGSAVAAIIVAIRSGNRQAAVASSRAVEMSDAAKSDAPKTKLGKVVSGLDPQEAKEILEAIQHMPGNRRHRPPREYREERDEYERDRDDEPDERERADPPDDGYDDYPPHNEEV